MQANVAQDHLAEFGIVAPVRCKEVEQLLAVLRMPPVAQQPWLDVLSAERPLQQWVVSKVDLADCEVVASSPPRIYGGYLAIGQGSKFVPGQF